MFDSLFVIVIDVAKIATAPIEIAADVARVVTKPVADVAEGVIEAFQEEVKFLKGELKEAEKGCSKTYKEGYRDGIMDSLKD